MNAVWWKESSNYIFVGFVLSFQKTQRGFQKTLIVFISLYLGCVCVGQVGPFQTLHHSAHNTAHSSLAAQMSKWNARNWTE